MTAGSITASTVTLRDGGGNPVAADVTYDAATRTATLDPTAALAEATTYTATVKGGASGVKDSAGNALASDDNWNFSTASPPGPPPDEGPGGPVLVLSRSTAPFSRYYAEILRTEGLNEFTVKDISTVTAATLGAYDVVIVGDFALTAAQVTMLSDWVERRRRPRGDAARQAARRPARADRRRRDAGRRLPADRHVAAARRRPRRRDDPVPRDGGPLHAQRRHQRGDALLERLRGHHRAGRDHARRRRAAAARPRRSRSTSPARSSTRARATRPGTGRSATARRRSARTTCSSAARRPTGSTAARSRSPRPTSSSACWRT